MVSAQCFVKSWQDPNRIGMSECLWEIFLAFQHFIALRPILVRLIRQRFQTKHRKKSKKCPLPSTVGQPNNPETLLYLPSILSLQPVMFPLFLLYLLSTWRLSMYWMIPVVVGMSCFSYLPSLPRDQVRHEYISLKSEVNTWQGPHLLVK